MVLSSTPNCYLLLTMLNVTKQFLWNEAVLYKPPIQKSGQCSLHGPMQIIAKGEENPTQINTRHYSACLTLLLVRTFCTNSFSGILQQ